MSEHIRLSIALCRIGLYTCLRTLCCKGPPTPRPEYDVVCIGLSGAGKTALLSRLCSEGIDGIVPTTGFSIKAVSFSNAVLNVKELGARPRIGPSDLERTRLDDLVVIPAAICHRPARLTLTAVSREQQCSGIKQEIKKYFELEPLARGKRWILEGSTINNMEAVRESFAQLISLLEEKELRQSRM
ncbi:ADP-ribosylation factor-like protein 15 [Hoplias malabaricus]|uniref:ADP-ribosylation factor-like protein 15 n=1 Tax=Hoplias malabaricus TaxID=27720 RepID=UPI0034635FC1